MPGLLDGVHLFGEDFSRDLSRRMSNPLTQMGLSMIQNSGPSLTPKSPFAGVAEGVARGIGMQGEQEKKAREEAAKLKTIEMLRVQNPELAAMIEASDADAGQAMELWVADRNRSQQMAVEDSRYERQRADELADREAALGQPDWQTFTQDGNLYRYNLADPNSQPELWHEGTPAAPDQPADVDEYNFYVQQETGAGREPLSYFDYGQAKKGNGLSITTPDGTTVTQGGGKYGQTVDTGFGKMMTDIQQGGMNAIGTMDTLDIMEQTMSDPSFYSGWGAEQVLAGKQMAAAMGIDPESVTSMETFNSMSKQSVMDSAGGSLGTGIATSDRDYIQGTVPTLANTPEGNRQLIEIARKKFQRDAEVALRAQQYEAQHGQLDASFISELATWAEANPLFGPTAASDPFQNTTSNGVQWSLE